MFRNVKTRVATIGISVKARNPMIHGDRKSRPLRASCQASRDIRGRRRAIIGPCLLALSLRPSWRGAEARLGSGSRLALVPDRLEPGLEGLDLLVAGAARARGPAGRVL